MKHFRSILATTDLSPESFSAVQYAVHLAKAQAATLTVVHVVETTTMAYADMVAPMYLTELHQQIEKAARDRLAEWVKHHSEGVSVNVEVRDGFVHDAICKAAADIDASLIVMATHGRQGMKHVLLGSVTERVLREAPCPVLVVRPPSASARKQKAA